MTWYDLGIGTYKVWAERLNSLGQSQWMPNGVRVGQANGPQYYPTAVKDGSGGEPPEPRPE